jgi:hypothetical protein
MISSKQLIIFSVIIGVSLGIAGGIIIGISNKSPVYQAKEGSTKSEPIVKEPENSSIPISNTQGNQSESKGSNLSDNKEVTQTATKDPVNKDELAVSCAKTLLLKKLKAPGSAQLVDSKMIEKDNYGRYLVYLEVDAQNSFGALLRSQHYVVLQSVKDDGKFTYLDLFSIQEIDRNGGSYIEEMTKETVKSMNNWNEDLAKPKKNDSGEQSSADDYEAQISDTITNFEEAWAESVNRNNYSLVSEYIIEGSKLYASQKKVMDSLVSRGIQEEFVNSQVLDEVEISPGVYKAKVHEEFNLTYANGKKENADYDMVYIVQSSPKWGLSDIQSISQW